MYCKLLATYKVENNSLKIHVSGFDLAKGLVIISSNSAFFTLHQEIIWKWNDTY